MISASLIKNSADLHRDASFLLSWHLLNKQISRCWSQEKRLFLLFRIKEEKSKESQRINSVKTFPQIFVSFCVHCVFLLSAGDKCWSACLCWPHTVFKERLEVMDGLWWGYKHLTTILLEKRATDTNRLSLCWWQISVCENEKWLCWMGNDL